MLFNALYVMRETLLRAFLIHATHGLVACNKRNCLELDHNIYTYMHRKCRKVLWLAPRSRLLIWPLCFCLPAALMPYAGEEALPGGPWDLTESDNMHTLEHISRSAE